LLDYGVYGDTSYIANNPASPAQYATYAGTRTNIGGNDILHGEGGDDVIYGETGADTLFGDGQNDILYGNSGGDWISGGTGDDGVIADDGLLRLQRNGVAEALEGLAATAQGTAAQNGDKQA